MELRPASLEGYDISNGRLHSHSQDPYKVNLGVAFYGPSFFSILPIFISRCLLAFRVASFSLSLFFFSFPFFATLYICGVGNDE
ncbi:hypothetical protein BDV34DRAFT_11862 [Aspergillus parasiticus]|uniref:Uncharacterized protein n=1 Tax=Aspergillus parasiticus TaxID=5067 RepID=A0A5N6D5W1_ASPPA|nr:hypothetical protein BDV34DRAFT_11862 [Aspergillus parasiticus]